jgi:hypothetical protein
MEDNKLNKCRPFIVGVSGKKRSGKSTFADMIVDECAKKDLCCVRMSFADMLKETIQGVFGINEELLWGDDDKKSLLCNVVWSDNIKKMFPKYKNKHSNMTVRELLQFLGTDVFRLLFGENVWKDALFRKVAEDSSIQVIILDDCRFNDECDKIIELEGILIRLRRGEDSKDSHESETALDNYNWKNHSCLVIDKNASIEEYKKIAHKIVEDDIERKVK